MNLQNHKLPPAYNFHKYMVRSMEDDFAEIVGIRYYRNASPTTV